MPTKGQVLTNPTTGDVFDFIETAKDSNGERVTIKSSLKGKGVLVPDHFHVLQDESFEILSGKLTVRMDGGERVFSAGEKVTLPKNKAHNHFNSEDEPVIYIHTTSPALDFDYFIENLVGLASDGKMKNGKIGLVQQLVTLKYTDSKAYLADLPVGIQNTLMNVVAPMARLVGYRLFIKSTQGLRSKSKNRYHFPDCGSNQFGERR
ncbi:cupin domain-containing protein [Telluribacter sp.]|jgi:quercetin dioxygenase-like cupin family protein|uniref:cupin domain-containing protein n=1 Tax=Telluribacter sp. TaxID=1978767 RepID=UPI002E0E5BF4|nr:cupin domain-containing protein [Telluribacter sp.]